jgi:uncharacterized OsmC-like protein
MESMITRGGIMTTANQKIAKNMVNGVDADHVQQLAGRMQQDKDFAQFRFRAANDWIDGAHSRTHIQSYFAGHKERRDRNSAHQIDADQPFFLGGSNLGPNPVEYVLHALNSCLTVTLVSHASVQGIVLKKVETSSEGEMDARGFFGISDQVNKGYSRIRVVMRVRSDSDVATLTALAMHSPVYEMISRAVPIDFSLTKI